MKVVLKGFSQQVIIGGEDQVFLDFVEEESGQEFRLPVPQETVAALATILHGNEAPEPPDEPEEEEEEPPPPPPPAPRPPPQPVPGRKRMMPPQLLDDDGTPPL